MTEFEKQPPAPNQGTQHPKMTWPMMVLFGFWIVLAMMSMGSGFMTVNYLEKKQELEQIRNLPPDGKGSASVLRLAMVDGTPTEMRFSSVEAADMWDATQKMSELFPLKYMVDYTDDFLLVLSAGIFGLVGAIIRLVITKVFQPSGPPNKDIILLPILGFFTGLVVFAGLTVLPEFLVFNAGDLRPTTVVFFTLFAGMFNRRFYGYLQNVVEQWYSKSEK